MSSALAALKEANRLVLASIAEREKALADKERTLTDELTKIENERRALVADRETVQKAESIHTRLLGAVAPSGASQSVQVSELPREGGQARARIGRQRYLMLVALRDRGPLSQWQIANLTGLNPGRVREQMRADMPLYVALEPHLHGDLGPEKFVLAPMGMDLLSRFENYRRSSGKPLPTLDDDQDDNDNNDDDTNDAGVQTNEPADADPGRGSSTGSITDPSPVTEGGIFD